MAHPRLPRPNPPLTPCNPAPQAVTSPQPVHRFMRTLSPIIYNAASAPLEKVELQRYQITGRLGAGADYDVRAAIDLQTGNQVALKRPIPQAITRNQHHTIEARTARLLQAYTHAGHANHLLAPILAHTETASHDPYFGDDLRHPYTIIIQTRAPGIPLLGDLMSRITGTPIAAPQNLFALFPLIQPPNAPPFPIQNQLLQLAQTYLEAGYILLDLRPQNIFYQPAAARIQVIDAGALTPTAAPAPRGRPPIDVNDACLELLKFYAAPAPPPQNPAGYREPPNLRPIISIPQELNEMRRALTQSPPQITAPAAAILDKIAQRHYTDYHQFAADLNPWLQAIAQRNRAHPDHQTALTAWRQALEWLRAGYWTRFQFNHQTELAPYS